MRIVLPLRREVGVTDRVHIVPFCAALAGAALALAMAACGSDGGQSAAPPGGTQDGAAPGAGEGPDAAAGGGPDAVTGGGSDAGGPGAATDGSHTGDAGSGAGEGGWSSDAGLPTGPAYYVATDGADANAGTDVAHPFLTIGKAASVAKAGDTVVIRGGTYRETVTLASSGVAGSPITFQSYPGETATVSGADVLPSQAWTVHAGSIYQAPMAWTLGVGMDQLFVDGVMMNEARWPNTTLDVSHPKTATVGSVSGTSPVTISDPALTQPAGFWTGAHVNMGAGKQWIYKSFTVSGSSPGQLTFTADTSNPNYAPTAGNLYYLWGTLAALDTSGEWFHDAAAKTAYLWTPQGDSPAGHVVEAKRRTFAFDLGGHAYVVLRGLRIFGATVTMSTASHDNVIEGVAARYVSHALLLDGSYGANSATTGLLVAGTNQRVADSAIAFSSGNGVKIDGNGNTVFNCIVHDVDYATTECATINPSGSNVTITNNTLYDAGRSVLLFKVQASKALNILIYGGGLQADDLGGVYTYGTDGMGSVLAYNVVHTVRPSNQHKGMAIYLDNNSSNYVVHHNLGYDVSDDGMIINTVSTNNLIYNNTYAGGIHGGGTDPGVRIINNIFTGVIHIGTGATVQNDLVKPTDPLFVDPAAGNYQLQAGSPAVDKGVLLPPYTDGFSGSAPDLGAFERGAPPWTAGSSLTSDGF